MKNIKQISLFLIIVAILVLSACQPTPEESTQEIVKLEPTIEVAVATNTPAPEPIATNAPPAIRVNGDTVSIDEVQAGIGRYEIALAEVGEFMSTENVQQTVMDELITQTLMSQKAKENGFILSDQDLDARISTAIENAGGQEAFNNWLYSNYFTADTFRIALRREIEAAWMRDQVIATVPTVMEQVLAREIFFLNELDATRVYNQLLDGSTFDSRVLNYDPQELGYLGWFPRGVLFDQVLEDAIFALQPEQYTRVIQTENGYHIAEMIERQESREVAQDLLFILQEKALEDCLAENLNLSTIEILI